MTLTRPVAALAAVGALLLTGCTVEEPRTTASEPPTYQGPDIAEGLGSLEAYYEQDLSWETCTEATEFECATVAVPLDYELPEAGSLEIALTRPQLTDEQDALAEREPVLLNPGGPGGSGIRMVQDRLDTSLSQRLRQETIPIGFDPRGVGASAPLRCLDDAALDERRASTFDGTTDADLAELVSAAEEYQAACERESGDLVDFLDTASTARDMDIMRSALGIDTLNYVGTSYGTKLGAVYAELFPAQVGRFVLDGGLEPDLELTEVSAGQARGMEDALAVWASWCVENSSDSCTAAAVAEAGTAEELIEQIRSYLAEVDDSPLTIGDEERTVTASMLATGIAAGLYSDTSWPALGAAVAEAFTTPQSPTVLVAMSDILAGRDASGSYEGSGTEAFTAINCSDYQRPSGLEEQRDHADQLAEDAPTFGPYFGYAELACAGWDEPTPAETNPDESSATQEIPAVVIGTTGGPATPFAWSESLVAGMDNAVLVRVEGQRHGAYPGAGQCVVDLVDEYLLEGTIPAGGITC